MSTKKNQQQDQQDKKPQEQAAQAASEAATAAAAEAPFGAFEGLLGGAIEITQDEEEKPKYTVVKGVSMQQFGGAIVKTNGVLDETKSILAAAVARPGSTDYAVRSGNNLTRTIMFGDVAIYAFNEKTMKVGARIMPTKSWRVMQSKTSQGEERTPFIRTPWDVRTQVVSQTGNLQAPSLDRQIKVLADIAMNLAATECLKRIEADKPSQVQENYNTAIQASAAMADIISNRRGSGAKIQFGQDKDGVSSAAAELLV